LLIGFTNKNFSLKSDSEDSVSEYFSKSCFCVYKISSQLNVNGLELSLFYSYLGLIYDATAQILQPTGVSKLSFNNNWVIQFRYTVSLYCQSSCWVLTLAPND